MQLKDAGIYDIINIFKGEPTAAHAFSQGGVINNKSRVINIPAYQRPYRWQRENIEKLFDDYFEKTSEYFIGSAVYVEKNKEDGSIEFDVVDGQQRITTLYLLNYVRYLLLRRYIKNRYSKGASLSVSKLGEELKECYVNLIGKNSVPFDNILSVIDEIDKMGNDVDQEVKTKKLVDCYNSELGIVENLEKKEDTYNEKSKKINPF